MVLQVHGHLPRARQPLCNAAQSRERVHIGEWRRVQCLQCRCSNTVELAR